MDIAWRCQESIGLTFHMFSKIHPSIPHLDGFALIAPAGEIPFVGKITALPWFHRLNDASIHALEKNTGTIRARFESESAATGAQLGVAFDKFAGSQSEEFCDGVNFFIAHTDKSRPTAAVATALANVTNPAHAKIRRQTATEAITPARSARSPAGTAWRVRRMATEPK